MNAERWKEIESLYHAALEYEPSKRSRLLQAADPEVRREVELLLAQEGSLLDHPVWTHVAPELAVGAIVGRYEIEALLGAGGMGEVFRARDTRLSRSVAIKTSCARFSDRFEREARAISTLNHPHICTLYDVGPDYLVMELIEGETLAARLKRGPLPIAESLRYGVQIAGALTEAHMHDIVHRDLKPSNIMLTRHGVKVLDFGLAKILSETNITDVREVMGTPAYVAPEQVERQEPTGLTDLFSLGLVLYEMVAGRLPVQGASLGRMLASGARPSWPAPSRGHASVSPRFDRLIARLLERDPASRPQSASEVGRELASLAAQSVEPRPRRFLAGAGLALLILFAAGAFWLDRRLDLRAGSRIGVDPVSYTQLTSFTDAAVGPALSPDGRILAFFRSASPFLTPDQIWVKLLPDGEPVEISHDRRLKYNLAFSPDGSRIAYTVLSDLFHTEVISTLGGDSQLLLPNSAGLSWLDKDHLLFSQIKTGIHMGIVTSRADGSELREIYFPRQDRGMAHYSYLSPDRKWVLLAEMDPQWRPCRMVPFSGGAMAKQVGPDGACTSAAWSPDGKWMYFAVRVAGRRHLWRQRFPDGTPQQITYGSTEEEGLAMAADGRSVISSISVEQSTVWIHDAHGERALSTEGYAAETPPVFSPDGKHLYYLLRRDSPESPAELNRVVVDTGKSEVVLPGVSVAAFNVSEDEKEVVFSTQPDRKPSELWIARLDRSSPPRRIAASDEATPYFGPDNEILFRFSEENAYYLGAMARDGTGRRKVLPYPIFGIWDVSPDRRFAMLSSAAPAGGDRTDRPSLAVPLNGDTPRQICADLCTTRWSPDGKYFYVEITPPSREEPGGKTAAIPVYPGESLPRFPAAGFRSPQDWLNLPSARLIEAANITPGPDPSTYAYVKPSVHANLFRIPLR
jgi:eukaryotic-like serine/threonine-protein kinase